MPGEPPDESIKAKLQRHDREAWDIFDQITLRARAAIHRKFGPDKRHYSADDNVGSARRTILRQIVEESLDFDDWHELEGLLVMVAYRRRVDMLRKGKAEDVRAIRYQVARQRDAVEDQTQVETTIDECLMKLSGALRDEIERIIFKEKLNQMNEQEIAAKVEKETGDRMTKYMVRETWRELRARFSRLFPDMPGSLIN